MSPKTYLLSPDGVAFLRNAYEVDRRSTYSIAEELGCYPNLIRRAIRHHGLPLRDKSEAQKAALSSGRHAHPTKGKKSAKKESG